MTVMKLLPLILMLAGCAAVPVTPPPTFPPLRITLDSVQSAVQPEVVLPQPLRIVNIGGANWAVVYPPSVPDLNWKVLSKNDLSEAEWTEEPNETDGDATIVHTNGRPNLFIRIVGEPKAP